MRFARLDLLRFGSFTDRSIGLPRLAADLHILAGPNEAGKSTTRSAVRDFLFGIGAQTPYNFRHAYHELCIGAVVENGSGARELRRTKGTKNTLKDENGVPVDEAELRAMLGGADVESYQRLFSLDHDELVRGGILVLEAKDDIGQMLFQSASGIAGLADAREELDREAAALFATRGKKAAYNAAGERLVTAEREIRAVTVRAAEYVKARNAVAEADAGLDQLKKECALLDEERIRLDRIRRVAPHLAMRRDKLAEREALGDVPRFPSGARATLDEAERILLGIHLEIAQLESAIHGCRERASVAVDESVLARRVEIERLAGEHSRIGDFPDQIRHRQIEIENYAAELESLAAALGWKERGADEIAARLPARVLAENLSGLAMTRDRVAAESREAKKSVHSCEREIGELEQELRAAPPLEVPPALVDALARTSGLGDVARRHRDLTAALNDAKSRLEHALARLAPWSGSIEALRAAELPDVVALAKLDEDGRAHAAERESLRARLADVEQQIAAAKAVVSGRAPGAVGADALFEIRAQRDAAWTQIRESFVEGRVDGSRDDRDARAGVLGLSIARADDLADRRMDGAAEDARIDEAGRRIADLEKSGEALRTSLRSRDDAVEAATGARAALLSPLGLEALGLAEIHSWVANRREALAAALDVETATKALGSLRSEEAEAVAQLRGALADAGVSERNLAGLGRDGLVAAAKQIERDTAEQKGKRKQSETQLAALRRKLPGLEEDVALRSAELDRWSVQWQAALEAAGLPATTAIESIPGVVNRFTDIEKKILLVRRIREKNIETMQADLDAFDAATRRLAAEIAPDLASRHASEIVLCLAERLDESKHAEARRREALGELERHERARAEAVANKERATTSLAPLCEAAKTTELAGLRAAIETAEAAAQLEADADEAKKRALHEGEGFRLAELEAEDAADDRATRIARIEQKKLEAVEAGNRREEAAVEASRLRTEFQKIAGAADAASAAADRESALAEMRDAVEGYLRARIQSRLLAWAVERYRREKQGPLLRRASEIFSTLTLGRFGRLEADDDGGRLRIVGIRADGGAPVAVDGMSDGTRDQLYLALRIAALELQIEKGTPIPVIADDILVNFDDERAAAGLRVLSELATRTQVLVFTHHRHLLGVARDTLGDGVGVVEV